MNFPCSMKLAVERNRKTPSLSSLDVSDTSYFFSCFTHLPVHPLYAKFSYTTGSSRQLKEVTLYSHARQGETPSG